MKNNYYLKLALITGGILLIPLVMTFFGSGVDGQGWHWTLADFVVIGALIFGTGTLYEVFARRMQNATDRTILGVILLGVMLVIYVDLAVGIFNIPGISGS